MVILILNIDLFKKIKTLNKKISLIVTMIIVYQRCYGFELVQH